MPACGSNLEGALYIVLSLHVSKVQIEVVLMSIELSAGVDDGGRECIFVATEEVDDLSEVLGAIDFQAIDDSGFVNILLGYDESLVAHLACFDSDGQRTAYGLQ